VRNLLRTFALLLLSGFLAGALFAQEKTTPSQNPKFTIYVDTAGVAPLPTVGQYITWIYAKTSDDAPPSSGVLVAFDCKAHEVMRVAHVVFHLAKDGKSVEGEIVEEAAPEWVPVTNPAVFDKVCEVGAEHARGNWGPDLRQNYKHSVDPKVLDPRVRSS